MKRAPKFDDTTAKASQRKIRRLSILFLVLGLVGVIYPFTSSIPINEIRSGLAAKSSPHTGWRDVGIGIMLLFVSATGFWQLRKLPNQSSEPALSSVTPPAGQESRPH